MPSFLLVVPQSLENQLEERPLRRESRAKRNFCQTTANKSSSGTRIQEEKSGTKQPSLSQCRLLTHKECLGRDHVPKTGICGAGDEAINSLLRELIWRIWVCAAGVQ